MAFPLQGVPAGATSYDFRLDQVLPTGVVANYRVANFMQFEGGKLIKNLSLLDTFDAVEQLLGQRIQIGNSSSESSEYADVVAV